MIDQHGVVAEAERLLKDITPGEWRVSMSGFSVKSSCDDMPIVATNPWGVGMREKDAPKWSGNADFIAAAPRLVRQLLALLSGAAVTQDAEQKKEI